MELPLAALLLLSVVGKTTFVRFEIETSRARLLLKWLIVVGLTLGLHRVVGNASVAVPLLSGGAGALFHVIWCRRHGIHPIDATPRDRYYELRGWTKGNEWAPIDSPSA
ncbi:MAG: hypothetical protein AAGA81_25130 [Acidobacteriota bacterium]